VRLHDERLAVILDPIDQVHLPKRSITREQLLMYPRAHRGQLRGAPGRSKAVMEQVAGEVDASDLSPLGARQAEPLELDAIAEPWQPGQARADQSPEIADFQWSTLVRRGLEEHDAGDVHGQAGTLERQEAGLQSSETLSHGSP
jgi:hypothetical protein